MSKTLSAQAKLIAQYAKMGWTCADRLEHASKPGDALVLKHAAGNVAIVYPDASVDRLEGRDKTLKYREGWSSPAERAKQVEKMEALRRKVCKEAAKLDAAESADLIVKFMRQALQQSRNHA